MNLYALITVRRYESCKRYQAELIRLKYDKEEFCDCKPIKPVLIANPIFHFRILVSVPQILHSLTSLEE